MENIKNNNYCFAISLLNDSLREGCSSGGVATGIAYYFLKNNGIVYGASSKYDQILHIRVDNLNELNKIKGSKYVQSDMSEVFRQIKSDLQNNKKVLFIGTPCQAKAVELFTNNNNNLYTISFACGGVPSLKFLKEELAFLRIKDYQRIRFRDKTNYIFEVLSSNNDSIARKNREESHYLRFFDRKLTIRESCIKCPFSQRQRIGDFTIGDYWGFNYTSDNLQFKPMSFINIQTSKGIDLFHQMKGLFYIKKVDFEDVCKFNDRLVRCSYSRKLNIKRNIFRYLYRHFGYENVIKIFNIKDKIKGNL